MEFMFCETHLRVCKGNVLNLINTQFNFADQFEELICGPAELLSIYTYIYGHWPGFKSNYAKDLIKHFSIYIYIYRSSLPEMAYSLRKCATNFVKLTNCTGSLG